jgi:hypothetical protein
MKKLADRWLIKIQVNQKKLSVDRLQWWLIIVLTKLFGRRVEIAESGGKTLRIFPLLWGGKVHLLGSEHDFLQIDYTSQYTLRLKTAPTADPGLGTPITLQPSRQDSCVHIILCHLSPKETDAILQNAASLGENYKVLLAYGGPEANFAKINFSNKVFIPDPSLRGQSNRIAYYDLITRARDWMKSNNLDPEWIFISDYDLIPLKKNYLNELVALMKTHGAGFGGKVVRDISLSNNSFLIDSMRDGTLDRMPLINGSGRKPVYHCLGAALFFHRSCFDTVLDFRDELNAMFFEVTLPTVAGIKGFRLLSFDDHSKVFEKVHYRPVFSCNEALEVANQGYALIHPLKDFAKFQAMRDNRPPSK